MGFFQFLASQGMPHGPAHTTVTLILALRKEYQSHFDKYFVDELARERGHVVVRLPPYHCIFNPIEMLWAYQKHLVRYNNTFRTIQEAIAACQNAFQQIPGDDLGLYFDHAKQEEDRYWRLDGLMDIDIAPVIIPLYGSDEDENDESDEASEDECDDISAPDSSSSSDEFL